MKKLSLSLYTMLLIGVIMIWVSSNLNWSKENWHGIIAVDATGYYAYLPATFIYKDPNFQFLDTVCRKKYNHKFHDYEYRVLNNDRLTNKYFIGTAVLQSPFFLIAHGLSFLLGEDSDGYSKIYMVLLQIGTVFYLLLGLFYFNKLLGEYKISTAVKIFSLIVITFGTNLFHYVVEEPGMSHVFSFSFFAMFAFYIKRYFTSSKTQYLLKIGLILGIILLIRPINGLIILSIPFLAGWKNLKIGVIKAVGKYYFLAFSFFIILLVLTLQPLFYYWGTNEFWIYSYGDESLDLLNPNVYNILFSYKKGLFLYTPVYLMSLFGFWTLWKKNRFQALTGFLFLFSVTYILSSWWQWYYGGSFSSRVFIEYLPFFGLLFALFSQSIWRMKWKRKTWLGVILLLVVVCQLQTYQYRRGQIHWSEMTEEKYWDVFLGWKKVFGTNER